MYEHIHRLHRLCNVHVHHKIKIALVPEDVKVQLCNLMCISHPRWDDALADICTQGGQVGTGKRHDNLNGWVSLTSYLKTGSNTKLTADSRYTKSCCKYTCIPDSRHTLLVCWMAPGVLLHTCTPKVIGTFWKPLSINEICPMKLCKGSGHLNIFGWERARCSNVSKQF